MENDPRCDFNNATKLLLLSLAVISIPSLWNGAACIIYKTGYFITWLAVPVVVFIFAIVSIWYHARWWHLAHVFMQGFNLGF